MMTKRNSFLRNPKSFSVAARNFGASVKVAAKAPKVIYSKSKEAGEKLREDYEAVQKFKNIVNRTGSFRKSIYR